ncbi:hypothetical protein Aperf_G00000068855 [Anoplocephala perfoliata]
MSTPDEKSPGKIKPDSHLGPSARRLQHTIPKSSTLGPTEYAISKSPGTSSRFFKTFRIRRRNSSTAKLSASSKMQSDRSLLTRSMITEASPGTHSMSSNFRSRLHRSAGSINLCDDAMGTSSPLPPAGQEPSSMITSEANNTSPVLKNPTGLGKGKPRQLKRRRLTGIHPKSASVEPHPDELALTMAAEALVFQDDCSVRRAYPQSIDHSFTASPTPNVGDNGALSPHRRTRSASGSNTKLGSLWSFICNGNSACTSTRRANESVTVPP